jgi:hypothetical protein
MLHYENKHFEFGNRPQIDDAVSVRVYIRTGNTIVILSELGGGRSVTNAIEQIATNLMREVLHGTSYTRIVWIEHYPVEDRSSGESWDLVTFDWSGTVAAFPEWSNINRKTAEGLAGTDL